MKIRTTDTLMEELKERIKAIEQYTLALERENKELREEVNQLKSSRERTQ